MSVGWCFCCSFVFRSPLLLKADWVFSSTDNGGPVEISVVSTGMEVARISVLESCKDAAGLLDDEEAFVGVLDNMEVVSSGKSCASYVGGCNLHSSMALVL